MGRSILHCAASVQRNELDGADVADSKIPAEVKTAGALINWVTACLDSSDVFFGHGTDNSRDEAGALVYHVMQLDHCAGNRDYGVRASPQALAEIQTLLDRQDRRSGNRCAPNEVHRDPARNEHSRPVEVR